MKKIILFILVLTLNSCLIQLKVPNNDYLTIQEIKSAYNLSYKECRTIIKVAENNEINCKYDIIKECWTYDNTIDYNIFKLAESKNKF